MTIGASRTLVTASSADSHHSLAALLSASPCFARFASSAVQIPHMWMMRSGLLVSRLTDSTSFQALLSSEPKAALKRVAALLSADEKLSAAARPSAHVHTVPETYRRSLPVKLVLS